MTNRLNFTKATIEALPAPASGRVEYHDTKVQGLQLRVTSTGAKTFCVFKRVKGAGPERITLGRFPPLTVENARRDAMKILSTIASGANPAEAKRAIRGEMTFAELFEQYIMRHARIHKKTADEDEQRYKQYLATKLGKLKISTINRQVIAELHSSITIAGHPIVANRVLALISSVFGRAVEWSIVESNPAVGIRRNPETSRDRFIQAEEMGPFFTALSEEPNTTIRDFLTISLLVGARRENVLAMAWRDISFLESIWRIPETKNGTPQSVPLTAEVIDILRTRRAAEPNSTFVFSSHGRSGHLTSPWKGWLRVLDRAAVITIEGRIREAELAPTGIDQMPQLRIDNPEMALRVIKELAQKVGISTEGAEFDDLRIHDLRRTFGSFQAKAGSSTAIIGKSLNHKSQQATSIYARLDLDPVRASIEKATELMLNVAEIKNGTRQPDR